MQTDRSKNEDKIKEMKEAWDSIRPSTSEYPKRVERGHEHEELPALSVGERSAIAVTLPFVTVTKNHMANKRMKQESISLESQQFQQTVAKVLPRTDLKSRYFNVVLYFHTRSYYLLSL
jgi:hypothetical protein